MRSRLQEAELRHMQQELHLLEQQVGLEDAVRSATVSFLTAKASSWQEASASWHTRRADDAQSKEREVEVGREHAANGSAIAHHSYDCMRQPAWVSSGMQGPAAMQQ